MLRFLRQALPDILAKRTDVLSPRMVRIVADLASDWRQLDERIEPVTDEIETLAKSDDGCRRVSRRQAGRQRGRRAQCAQRGQDPRQARRSDAREDGRCDQVRGRAARYCVRTVIAPRQ